MLKVSEVAHKLGVSPMTVYRLVHSGELRGLRVGRRYRIKEEDFEEFVSNYVAEVDAPKCSACAAYDTAMTSLTTQVSRLREQVLQLGGEPVR